ncbi:MAG: S1 family peptidase [Endomicrobiales bacterium]
MRYSVAGVWGAVFFWAVLRGPVPCGAQGAEVSDVWIRESEVEAVMADMLSAAVVFLKNDTNGKYITGTLLKSSGTVVLTNYHVLGSSGDAVFAYLNSAENKVERFRCELLKGDRLLDLALFRITPEGKTPQELVSGGFVSRGTSTVSMPVTNRYLSPESFADDTDIKRGYRIAFLGFPLNYGLSIEKETQKLIKRPVFRTGNIASEAFEGEFLIGAMASNGNSGSPVFVRALYRGSAGVSLGYKLIGIIKEYQHDTIKGSLDGKKTVAIPHNTGLGIVIPIGVIREFIGPE